mgnify:CR=1 FL=1
MKIAITGKMCSGKSSLAKKIQESDPRYQIFSYGKKVKEVASDLFQMNPLIKDRSLLVNIATKMREIDPDIWSKYVMNQTKGREFCIIDDLRFQNELDGLIQEKWIIIQLIIPEDIQNQRIKQLYPDTYQDHIKNKTHLSEKNELKYPTGFPQLTIDTSEISIEEIKDIILKFI